MRITGPCNREDDGHYSMVRHGPDSKMGHLGRFALGVLGRRI